MHFLLMQGFLSFGCKQYLQLPHLDVLHPVQFLHLVRLLQEVPAVHIDVTYIQGLASSISIATSTDSQY